MNVSKLSKGNKREKGREMRMKKGRSVGGRCDETQRERKGSDSVQVQVQANQMAAGKLRLAPIYPSLALKELESGRAIDCRLALR